MNLYPTLVASALSTDDVVKVLIFVLVCIGLLGLGRWSSHLGGGSYEDAGNGGNISNSQPMGQQEEAPRVWAPGAEEIAASFPFDPLLGKIRIKKFFFEKVDAIPGPDDPSVFADELHVELYDPDSDHWWWQSYFVATPAGLAQILREKSWKYLHAPQILVLPRYDLEEIRGAVISRIMADHEYFKDKEQPEEESL